MWLLGSFGSQAPYYRITEANVLGAQHLSSAKLFVLIGCPRFASVCDCMAEEGIPSSAYVVDGFSATSEKEIYCENSNGTTYLVTCWHSSLAWRHLSGRVATPNKNENENQNFFCNAIGVSNRKWNIVITDLTDRLWMATHSQPLNIWTTRSVILVQMGLRG